MSTQQDELKQIRKLLNVFYTMRSNLALLNSFLRRSYIDSSLQKTDNIELPFLGVRSTEEQIKIHNAAVIHISIAILHQVLENYYEMIIIKPNLKDKDLETTLDQFGNREAFIKGCRIVRNRTFHVMEIRPQEHKALSAFVDIIDKKGGPLKTIHKIKDALYNFTGKCFMGELRIFPNSVYDVTKEETEIRLKKSGVDEATIKEILIALYNN